MAAAACSNINIVVRYCIRYSVSGNIQITNAAGAISGIYFPDGTYQTTSASTYSTPAGGPTNSVQYNTGSGFGGSSVYDIEIESDGNILVGGDFQYYGEYEVDGFVRLNSDGTPDTTLVRYPFEGYVYSILLEDVVEINEYNNFRNEISVKKRSQTMNSLTTYYTKNTDRILFTILNV